MAKKSYKPQNNELPQVNEPVAATNIMMLIKNSRVTIIRFFPFILSFREFIFLLIPFLFLANVPAILLLIHKLLFHLVFPD